MRRIKLSFNCTRASLRLVWKIAQVFSKPIEEVFSFEDEE
jgi:DNA-binding XRE family transcriptional regulator